MGRRPHSGRLTPASKRQRFAFLNILRQTPLQLCADSLLRPPDELSGLSADRSIRAVAPHDGVSVAEGVYLPSATIHKDPKTKKIVSLSLCGRM